jgi:Type II secretion system (T2SS), protein M subtype b
MDSRTALLNASPFRRRLAAIALPALAAVLAAAIGLAAYTTLQARADSVAERRAQLGRLNMILAAKPGPAGDPVAAVGGDGPEFLSGESEALVQAAFQSRLNDIAAASGVDVIAVGNTPIVVRGDARFAGLRASMSGTNDEVVDTIFAIETSEPYLTIRSARINSGQAGTPRDGGRESPQELLLQLQFEGALRPDSGPPEPEEAAN